MPKSDDLQMQLGARPKSARKRIQEREDEFTHDSWNIVPSGINFNAHNADGVFSKDRWRRASIPANSCVFLAGRSPASN